MRHVKTSFLLSGLYLFIEVVLAYFCLAARVYPVGGFLVALAFLELYRLGNKIRYLKNPLSPAERARRSNNAMEARGFYYNQWFRFAEAHDHEFISQKFHERVKKLR
jgi:hypothetical protein